MTCNCDNDGSNEYIIELNQQGAPGVRGEKGEQGYSPTVSYISDGSGLVINIVNEQDTISTPVIPLKSYVDTLSDTKMNTDGSNAASSVKFNNIQFSYVGATRQTIKTISSQELLVAGQGLYLQGHASQAQGYPNSITIAPQGTSISIGNANRHSVVVDNDGAFYDSNEIATVDQIPSITGKLNTDGSNATNTFTVNGVGLAGDYVYINGVSSGGISVTQSNSDIFAKLQVDSSVAQLRMPGLYLNSGATGNIALNTTRDIVINGSNTSDKMYYHGTSANNEVAIKGDIPDIMVGCDSITGGSAGLVPAPSAGDEDKFLKADGTWDTVGGGGSYTAGTGIDITNDTISVDSTILTTNTAQTVTGDKTFSNAEIQTNSAIILDGSNAKIRALVSTDSYNDIIKRSTSGILVLGNSLDRLNFQGNLTRPSYNSRELALLADVPTVGNGLITFTQGGVTKGSFYTNQGFNQTIELNAGGGSSYTAGNGIDITNDIISVDNTVAMKTDIPTNYVTTDTAQTITGIKTFSDSIKTDTVYNTNNNPTLQIYNTTIRVGNSNYGLKLLGDSTRPEYSMDGGTNYNQLALLSDMPTVNDPTITFTQGGTTKGTITLNQSSNQTIALDASSGGVSIDDVIALDNEKEDVFDTQSPLEKTYTSNGEGTFDTTVTMNPDGTTTIGDAENYYGFWYDGFRTSLPQTDYWRFNFRIKRVSASVSNQPFFAIDDATENIVELYFRDYNFPTDTWVQCSVIHQAGASDIQFEFTANGTTTTNQNVLASGYTLASNKYVNWVGIGITVIADLSWNTNYQLEPCGVRHVFTERHLGVDNKAFDGQWTNIGAQNIVNGSNITWTNGHNYDLSNYLPNDGHVYEVIFTASWTGSTAGSSHDLRASTDITTSTWNWLGRVSGQNPAAGTCIMPVGTGRYVRLVTGAKACNAVYFSALGYRRLGTNS